MSEGGIEACGCEGGLVASCLEGRGKGVGGGEAEAAGGAVVCGAEGGVVEGGVGDGFADVFDGALDGFHDHLNRRDVDALLADVFYFGGEFGPGLGGGFSQFPDRNDEGDGWVGIDTCTKASQSCQNSR